MKLRKLLAAGVGALGATAIANYALGRLAGEFDPILSGDHDTWRWRGFDVGYDEAGDPEDPDLVLLHGIHAAAANDEFHAVWERLAEDHHVIAPDLPGFGHADRPSLSYSASLYETFVRDFLADVPDSEPGVVASSLTGAYAASAAEDVALDRLVLICPTEETMGDRTAWKHGLLRSPVVGQGLFNLLVSKPALRYFHEDHGYADIANLSPAVLDYEWLSAHQPGARFAPAAFVAGYLEPDWDLVEAVADVDAPVELVWGADAEHPPLAAGRGLAERGDAGLTVFDRARLLPHVEHPEAFADVVRGEYDATAE
jgi:pimeloyl-ACP methyl ester carboxylesterase